MTPTPSKARQPLRTDAARMAFCDTYFRSVASKVVYQDEKYREYELPRDVDKELTERPYYWLWVEQTGQEVEPTVLRLAFSESVIDRENNRLRKIALQELEGRVLTEVEKMFFRPPTAEFLTTGSFRLDKIFTSIEKRGSFACLKPNMKPGQGQLVPWLLVNAKITRKCDSVEERLVSIGICLMNRQIVEQFYDIVAKIDMVPATPEELLTNCQISVEQGYQQILHFLTKQLEEAPRDWSAAAAARLVQDKLQLRTYYQSILPDLTETERAAVEIEARRKERELIERTSPRIEIEPRQIALIGLMERGGS